MRSERINLPLSAAIYRGKGKRHNSYSQEFGFQREDCSVLGLLGQPHRATQGFFKQPLALK